MPFEPAAEAAGHTNLPWHMPRRMEVSGCSRTRLERRVARWAVLPTAPHVSPVRTDPTIVALNDAKGLAV